MVQGGSGLVLQFLAGFGGHLDSKRDFASIPVQVANLREVIKGLASQRLLLKLDVEGEEDKILPGLVPELPLACGVFFEWHHGEDGLAGIHDLFNEAGFAVEHSRTRYSEDGTQYVDAFAFRC